MGHLPFLVSLLRMWWKDSESTRLVFYKTSLKTCALVVLIDIWCVFNLTPNTRALCEAINAYELTSDTGWKMSELLSKREICEWQYEMWHHSNQLFSDLQFVLLVLLAKRNWKIKRR